MTRGASVLRFRIDSYPARHQELERELGLVRTVEEPRSKNCRDRLERPGEVLGLPGRMGVEPHSLRLTASGHPEHPLRLPPGCHLGGFQSKWDDASA